MGFAAAGDVVATIGSGALRNLEKKPVVPSLMPPHVSDTLAPTPLQLLQTSVIKSIRQWLEAGRGSFTELVTGNGCIAGQAVMVRTILASLKHAL